MDTHKKKKMGKSAGRSR